MVAAALSTGLALAQPPTAPPKAEPPPAKPGGPVPARYQDRNPFLEDPLDKEYTIQLDVPSSDRLFRLESEAALFERIRQENRQRSERAQFPELVVIASDGKAHPVRQNPPTQIQIQASYVCYQPLYFEQVNTERYGWECGILQPLISTGKFYADLAMLPYNMAVSPPWTCDSNAGWALPGEPTPFYLYTPVFNWRGMVGQAGTLVGASAVFP
jgi:hypothetical protein